MVVIAAAALAFATAAPAASLLVAQGSAGLVDYQLDATGVPSSWSAQDATFYANRVIFSADGTRVFAASSTGVHATEVVRSYTRNPATGALTLVSSVGLGGGQEYPCSLALAPDGGHLYVTASGSGSNAGVSAYAIGVDGSLTAFAAGTFAVASYTLFDGLISPDGRSLYLGGQLYGSKILQYDIADGGAVTPKATPVVANGMDYMAITPNGRYLYGYGTGVSAVLGFPITAGTGALGTALAPVSTSPSAFQRFAVTPDGTKLIVANSSEARTFSLAADGTATQAAMASFTNSGTAALAVSPTGARAYVWNSENSMAPAASRVGIYSVGNAALTPQWSPYTPSANSAFPALAHSPAPPPIAAFTAAPSAESGQQVAFDGAASTAPEAGVATYAWDFGDGTLATSGSSTATHAYAAAGSYTASLTVTSTAGCRDGTGGVWNGRQYSCANGSSAVATRTITVAAPAAPAATSTASTAGASATADATSSKPALRATTPTPTVRADAIEVATSVTASGPGVITVVGTLPGARAAKAACNARRKVAKAGTYAMRCTLGRAARVALRSRALRVVLVTTFTPPSGTSVSVTSTVTVPRRA